MDTPTRPRTAAWILAATALAALVAIVMGGFGLDRAAPLAGATPATPTTLVRWRDAGRDWLLVGDGASDQLSIYSAVDGRLVRRLAVRRGLNDANALAQRDGRLFVVGDDGSLGELNLSPLPMVAANSP